MYLLAAALLAAFDPASLDPRIVVTTSSADVCAGVGLQQPVPAPVRVTRSFPSSYWGCGGWMTGDGQGDVAFQCTSYLPESGWAEVISADGTTTNSQLKTYAKPVPLDDGFASSFNPAPYGPNTQTTSFAWFDGARWQLNQFVQPAASGWEVAGHAWTGAVMYRTDDGNGSGPMTQWVDTHGNALSDPLYWNASSVSVRGVDSLGNALVLLPGAAAFQWIDQGNNPVGDQYPWTNRVSYPPWDPLIGGGLIARNGAIYPDGAPSDVPPSWLNGKPGDMQVVNAGAAYAFTREGQCTPTVSLYAPDGTLCGSVSLYGATDACPQPASLGVDGTLIQDVRSGTYDQYGAQVHVWRWWPQMFR